MARVLIIEDDKSMNEILVTTLVDEDHQVISAFSGDEALGLCRQHTFDLLITDVRLPGPDGVETLGELRKLQPSLKCIVITVYAQEDTPIRAIRLNVDDYLFKPFSLSYFLKAVERVLNQEQEKTKKRALVRRLFERFGLTMGDDNDARLRGLVKERQEAFRGLYVGVRSGYLNRQSANQIYVSLESLENEFRKLLNSKAPSKDRIYELQEHYHDLQERLALMRIGAEEESNLPLLTDEVFSPLYQAVKDSEISFEDLLYAPLLRRTPDSRFETLTELLELKRKLWPDSLKSDPLNA